VTTQACRQFTRQALLAINKQFRCVLDENTRDVIAELQLRRRECRAGEHLLVRHRRGRLFTFTCGHSWTQHGRIPVITNNRSEVTARSRICCKNRQPVRTVVQRCPSVPFSADVATISFYRRCHLALASTPASRQYCRQPLRHCTCSTQRRCRNPEQ